MTLGIADTAVHYRQSRLRRRVPSSLNGLERCERRRIQERALKRAPAPTMSVLTQQVAAEILGTSIIAWGIVDVHLDGKKTQLRKLTIMDSEVFVTVRCGV